MVVTSKGQVTIPQRIRLRHGLKPGTQVEFVTDGAKVVLRPREDSHDPVEAWLLGATGVAKRKTTTAQVMKLTRSDD